MTRILIFTGEGKGKTTAALGTVPVLAVVDQPSRAGCLVHVFGRLAGAIGSGIQNKNATANEREETRIS